MTLCEWAARRQGCWRRSAALEERSGEALGIQRLGFLASLRDFDPVIGFLGTRCPDL